MLGAGVGTFFMAFHANQGPRMGLPQMIQSRAQFGSRGVILPFLATVFVYVGFMVFDVILATDGLALVLPDVRWFWYPVLTALSIVIAVVGHDLLHLVQRWLTYVLIVAFAITTVLAFTLPAAPATAAAPGFDLTAFLVQFSLAAGYNISYAVYVSDYSRYLPANSSAPKLIFFTYLGAAGSAIWLMGLGSLLASRLPEVDAVGLDQAGRGRAVPRVRHDRGADLRGRADLDHGGQRLRRHADRRQRHRRLPPGARPPRRRGSSG